jgi:hypothetical protein
MSYEFGGVDRVVGRNLSLPVQLEIWVLLAAIAAAAVWAGQGGWAAVFLQPCRMISAKHFEFFGSGDDGELAS